MKKYFLSVIFGFLCIALVSSCHHRHSTTVSISDSHDEYQLCAAYDKSKTHRVQRLLDDELQDESGTMIRTNMVNEQVTLDDRTSFHLCLCPGVVRIKIDKRENSEASCRKIKAICEDIKDLLASR
jgi:hypothetical protein